MKHDLIIAILMVLNFEIADLIVAPTLKSVFNSALKITIKWENQNC